MSLQVHVHSSGCASACGSVLAPTPGGTGTDASARLSVLLCSMHSPVSALSYQVTEYCDLLRTSVTVCTRTSATPYLCCSCEVPFLTQVSSRSETHSLLTAHTWLCPQVWLAHVRCSGQPRWQYRTCAWLRTPCSLASLSQLSSGECVSGPTEGMGGAPQLPSLNLGLPGCQLCCRCDEALL
jgi:hypothetical protein